MGIRMNYIKTLLILPFLFKTIQSSAQEDETYQFTVFLIQSAQPLDWESPSSLYKTVRKSTIKKMSGIGKSRHVYGHSTFNLTSNRTGADTLWLGITSNASAKQELQYIFIKKIGLSVLGVAFPSKLEGRERMVEDLSLNQKHGITYFITYLISKESADQIQEFIKTFHENYKDVYPAPADTYGVGLWPLYNGEGASCLSLVLAAMETGGIVLDDSLINKLNIRVKIPIELVGGVFNEKNKVGIRKVTKTKLWFQGDGLKNFDYVDFDFYEPNNMIEWIQEQLNDSTAHTYRLPNGVELQGLQFDYRHMKPDRPLKEMMQDRPNPSLFYIKYAEAFKDEEESQ